MLQCCAETYAVKCRHTDFCKLCFTTDVFKIYKVHAQWSGVAMKWMRLNAWIALQKRGSPHLINFIWNRVMLMKSYTFNPPTPSSNFSPQKGSFTPVHKSSINWGLGSPAKHFKTKSAHIHRAIFLSFFQFSAVFCCHRQKLHIIKDFYACKLRSVVLEFHNVIYLLSVTATKGRQQWIS